MLPARPTSLFLAGAFAACCLAFFPTTAQGHSPGGRDLSQQIDLVVLPDHVLIGLTVHASADLWQSARLTPEDLARGIDVRLDGATVYTTTVEAPASHPPAQDHGPDTQRTVWIRADLPRVSTDLTVSNGNLPDQRASFAVHPLVHPSWDASSNLVFRQRDRVVDLTEGWHRLQGLRTVQIALQPGWPDPWRALTTLLDSEPRPLRDAAAPPVMAVLGHWLLLLLGLSGVWWGWRRPGATPQAAGPPPQDP